MLTYFKELSLNRTAWILLAIIALLLESTGLYFQYVMGLQPCVMCVYERLAISGLLLALLEPFHLVLNLPAILQFFCGVIVQLKAYY